MTNEMISAKMELKELVDVFSNLADMILKLKKKKIRLAVFCAFATAISAYGVYAFIKRGFPGYMSGRTMFAFFVKNTPGMQ